MWKISTLQTFSLSRDLVYQVNNTFPIEPSALPTYTISYFWLRTDKTGEATTIDVIAAMPGPRKVYKFIYLTPFGVINLKQ